MLFSGLHGNQGHSFLTGVLVSVNQTIAQGMDTLHRLQYLYRELAEVYDDMPVTDDGIIECLCSISEKKKMKAAVKHYKSCAFCGAVFPIVGAFLGGPPGIAIGGAIGSLVGAHVITGRFKPVSQILKKLSPAEKQNLAKEASAIVGNFYLTDTEKRSFQDLRKKLLTMLTNYITKELHAEIRYGD
ncbi:protein C19orf12 homolog isoform X2 [Apodemus sylvaticus]|uniref:protein C19orf12 homolog isoform X2 n=1 Tax=Apodemus sylvaticus TaxID=10129 RepID=UPI002241E885|nr:protein C19orf12 homolog isoform X2 [Apodemus sylvaticus]